MDLNKIIDNVTEADDSIAMSTLIRLNLVNACKYFGVTFKYTANTRKIFGDLYQRFKFSDHEKIFAFYYAIKAGRMDNVQLLKSSGFDLNKIKDQGTGILEYAIRYEDEFVVQKLLQMGVKPTEKTEIDKIVIETIKASNINILKLIFGAGLNSFKSMDYDNIRKLLVFACKIGNLSIIEELFGHAGSLSEGQRLEIAHLSKNDEIFMNFLNRGFVNRLGNGTINWFMHEILVEGDRPKLMKAIAESGANIYEENMVYNIYSGMLRANSALERRLTPSDSPSVTALIHSRNKSMEVFLEQGFNPNHRIFSGTSTLLHLACELKNVEIAKLLIKYGADTNALDKNNRTPFSYIDNSEMLAKLQDMSEFL